MSATRRTPRPSFHLGERRSVDGKKELGRFELPADHLLTHGVIVGMTGSGKTGLVTVLIEEALRAAIPVLIVDVKGDLPNLALAFPSFDEETMTPWIEAAVDDEDGIADPPESRSRSRSGAPGSRSAASARRSSRSSGSGRSCA